MKIPLLTHARMPDDRLALEAFLALPEVRRKLVRELITVLASPTPKRPA